MKNEKRIAKWIAKGILTIILLVFMWSAYPGYGFHTWYLSDTASHRYVTSETISNTVMTQYFTPILPYLKSVQLAVEFNEEHETEEKLTFVLCKETGKEVFSCEVPLQEMESNLYYEVEVNQRLKKGEVYYWSLTTPSDENYEWKAMYTEYPEDQAPENIQFLIGDNACGSAEAQTISRYIYYDHHDKVVIIGGFWAGALLAYIVGLEIINRVFKKHS